jgi:lipoate-protein ligase A
MLFVDNQNIHDPSLNLALEEYLLRFAKTDQDLLLFYINRPSIIIGRHQNTLEEINTEYVQQRQIQVVRRLSGGGAVYHDLGNLNFSFITAYSSDVPHSFAKFTAPVIQALAALGVQAELSGRNDIQVDGRKVSGNAQYITGSRMYSHGTLLFNSDLDHVGEALKVKPGKIASKGIKSIRSRVANISEFLPQTMSIEEFRAFILKHVFSGSEDVPQYVLTDEEWDAVHHLADERYRQWDWNYGQSPDYNIYKAQRFAGGEIELYLNVEQETIRSAKIHGDFFSKGDLGDLEQRLTGLPYHPSELRQALSGFEFEKYFLGFTGQEVLEFISNL